MRSNTMLRKIDKIILYSIFGSVPVGVALYFIYCMIGGPSTREITIKNELSESFNGKVDSIYEDKANHDEWYAILKNKYVFNMPQEWGWGSKIVVGDSLSKRKGSFLVQVYRGNNGKLTLDLNNPNPPF